MMPEHKNRIPVKLLFAKPHKDHLRISPKGTYFAWRGRVDGILNLYIQKLDRSSIDSGTRIIDPDKAKQLTFYNDRDACVHFVFTPDEKTILFIRDIKRGSESYHIHAIDIDPIFARHDNGTPIKDTPSPRDLIQDQNMTCAIGFTGAIQLWTTDLTPRFVYVSTAQVGPYAMFWDISQIDIDTGERVIVERNLMSTWGGRVYLVGVSIICLALKFLLDAILRLVEHEIIIQLPGIPIQWFPDNKMKFRGRIEVHLNLSFSFTARARCETGKWKAMHTVSFDNANLQLFGSSGGSGTAQMDFSKDTDAVDVHVCAFDGCDTTSYERFDLKTGKHIARLANNIKVDIAGFLNHPKTRNVKYVMYEHEKLTTEALHTNNNSGHDNAMDLADLVLQILL